MTKYIVVRNLRLPESLLEAVDAEAGPDHSRSAVVASKLARAYPGAVPAGWEYQGRKASSRRGQEQPVAQEVLDFDG